MEKKILALIYREYYDTVLGYCVTRLNGDLPGAEDCTQEVFYILQKKIQQLIQLESVLPWLFATADREIKSYKRKHPQNLNIDEIPEPAAPDEMQDSVLDILDDEDRRLAERIKPHLHRVWAFQRRHSTCGCTGFGKRLGNIWKILTNKRHKNCAFLQSLENAVRKHPVSDGYI